MARYVIWDEVSPVIVPTGQVFTAEQWMDQYPLARLDDVYLVVSGDSVINGAFCQEYTSLVAIYAQQGCDFTGCETMQDHLDAIEAFEDERNQPDENYVDPNERIAAALEAQVMMSMPDVDDVE